MKRRISVLVMASIIVVSSLAACGTNNDIDQPVKTATTAEATEKEEVAAVVSNDVETPTEEVTEEVSVASIEEHVLVEKDGVRITAKGFDVGLFGPEMKILIENDTDKNLTVQDRDSSINGYMVGSLLSCDVAAGKKANDSVVFYWNDIDKCGIETIADIELCFHVFGSEDWADYFDTDPIQVYTSAYEGYEYTFDDSGEEVYNGNGIRLVVKGVSTAESIFGPGLIVYIENESDDMITVQAREVSVNGYMIDTIMSQDVCVGKKSVTALTFLEASLEENEITEFSEVEVSFHVFNANTWDTIEDTDPITMTF